MIMSIDSNHLLEYMANQINYLFPDGNDFVGEDVQEALFVALDRLERCFSHITIRGYRTGGGEATFSHLHSDQYSQFLYFFANSLWKISGNTALCSKVVGLNKCLNGMFYSFKCELPEVFLFAHPVGSIIGNASYSDGLVIFQNVTINTGDDLRGDGATPKLGKGLFLGAGAKIIGEKTIGDRVSIGVDAMVYDEGIPDDTVVLRDKHSGKIISQPRKSACCMAQNYFDILL